MFRAKNLHFLKDWWKFIQIHQYHIKALTYLCFSAQLEGGGVVRVHPYVRRRGVDADGSVHHPGHPARGRGGGRVAVWGAQAPREDHLWGEGMPPCLGHRSMDGGKWGHIAPSPSLSEVYLYPPPHFFMWKGHSLEFYCINIRRKRLIK